MENKSKEEMRSKHWTEILADEIFEKKKEPFVITGGMTTSGPAHFGTVCEFLYPAILREVLESRGAKAQLHFVGDILDAFDSIPYEMQKYESVLTPELGKPLAHTLDPEGCHASFGIHYLDQAKMLIKKMSLQINVIEATELYNSGKVDPYTVIFFKSEDKVKEVVATTSMKPIEELKNWSPIMPICEKCGKIATTRVTSHTDEEYEYVCDRDVKYTKGCGFKGKAKLSDHKYKLQWRLHWPTWQAIFNSSVEGSGVDHMTRGGSATTAEAIHREILSREPPILFKYGFVLIHGKKYSKSKGIGMTAVEISELIPPELLKYSLIVPNIEQNKDIDPTGDKLILLYNEVERISKVGKGENRADEKKELAYSVAIKKLSWNASFVDMLLNYQIYKDWNKVGEMLNDREGVAYLSDYITKWLARGYAPERYNFAIKQAKVSEHHKEIAEFVSRLSEGMTDLEVHNLVYEIAKQHNVKPDDLFKTMYHAMIGKDSGPRMGKFITAIGISKSKEMLSYSIS